MTDRIQTMGSERFTARLQSLGAERLTALMLITFAVVEFYGAMQLSMSEEFTLGPGAMPAIYSSALLIFSFLMLIQPTRKAASDHEASSEGGHEEVVCDYRAGGITFGLVAAFIASIYFVGFLGGTIMFSLLYVLLISRWSVLQATAFGLIWGGAVYYGFDRLLGVQLETGILFGS
jgi:hypothetical protein